MDLDALCVSSFSKVRLLIMVISSDVCSNANKVSSVQPVGSYPCNKDVISMGAVSLDSVQEKALRLNIKLGVYGQLCSDGLLADFQYKKLCQKILSESLDFDKEQSYTEQQLVEATAEKSDLNGFGDEGEREVFVQ